MSTLKIKIDNQAQITEKGLKTLISKRGIENAVEAKAEWNNWDNCTTINVRVEGSHEFEYRFHKSKSGKIVQHKF